MKTIDNDWGGRVNKETQKKALGMDMGKDADSRGTLSNLQCFFFPNKKASYKAEHFIL